MIKTTLRHDDFKPDLPVLKLRVRPIPGDYIQYALSRNYRVKSVHMQGGATDIVAVVERVTEWDYDEIWNGKKP